MSEKETDSSKPLTRFQRIGKFLASHWLPVSILAFVSLFGFAVTLYQLLNPDARKLAYCINPTRFPIVQAAHVSKLTVAHDGQPMNGDVTGFQVAIWNAGKRAIQAADIKSSILLAAGTNQIFEASIIKEKGQPLGCAVSKKSDSQIELQFTDLEHKEGVLVQCFYTGGPEVPITVTGKILDQGAPAEVTIISKQSGWNILTNVLSFIVFLNLAVTGREQPKSNLYRRAMIAGLIFTATILVGSIIMFLTARFGQTPFGF